MLIPRFQEACQALLGKPQDTPNILYKGPHSRCPLPCSMQWLSSHYLASQQCNLSIATTSRVQKVVLIGRWSLSRGQKIKICTSTLGNWVSIERMDEQGATDSDRGQGRTNSNTTRSEMSQPARVHDGYCRLQKYQPRHQQRDKDLEAQRYHTTHTSPAVSHDNITSPYPPPHNPLVSLWLIKRFGGKPLPRASKKRGVALVWGNLVGGLLAICPDGGQAESCGDDGMSGQ